MKKLFLSTSVIIVAVTVFSISSCTQKDIEKEESSKIENTLKSVSLWQDSIKVDPAKLMASLEHINKAIDSIGYPDAGYQLWLLQSDTVADYRFLINGYWPNQEAYDEIHNHELYNNSTEWNTDFWKNLHMIRYDRFTRVK
jgi:hypothetical protein